MNRKITQEETKELFRFCHRHFVYQYDLQVELVDHLASSIETQWEDDAGLNFKQALHNTFRKFGITGFSKVKVEKEKALRKKYNRLLWGHLLEFYRWPKIIMTFAFTIILFTLFRVVDNALWVLIPYFVLLTLGCVYYYYKFFPQNYKINTRPGKSFMLLNQLKQVQYFAIVVVQLPIQAINFSNILQIDSMNNSFGLFIVSLLIIFFTIALYGELFYVPKKIKEHFMEQFSEFAA